ncbi:PRP38 family protein [Toxoplasma gondii ME49]|uniref:PRP38 family protein n=18 Tax=Toxoplasma gondii TaxID=5811 RepID=B9PT26_TOXGV|nr:PRP38 family protein [Toxoplasma gondii ME49]EPR59362.1 PRP38 family protein [Toxoplasma gondii GT1]ESS30588.1 PRP38 family protein [Toxoplasma gondii VEG]KAF4643904.1 PRP38 family protein [Toxoplasma gondii]KFG39895.1 PRP38 family protein [Toxoplasma gondii GAB2-2007-GAL-DOM2]KFG54692.1 PRP38 family protein [Toxoplasma gondii FOU]KFH08267.1 PRP38 family protein [Toxoplasma gondii VAND]KFH08502.1 PRP38 family protein [Toxoplasma gondii MAS]PUA87960.1 PRP38 family protein [Toxoplasma gond|eukprot:XP_002369181.1 PRP38 family protein [Toxoplasma gondii ME49]
MYPYAAPYGSSSLLPAPSGQPAGIPPVTPAVPGGVVSNAPRFYGAPAAPPAALPHRLGVSAGTPAVVAAPGPPATTAVGAVDAEEDSGDTWAVNRCHLHTKPQLHCKFCRKYKSFAQQLGILQKRELKQQEDDDGMKRNMVEMTDSTTYNVNALLRSNILSSEYFKSLHELKTVPEVVDEITQYAQHAEPYCSGSSRAPSTLFCCLYKLFTMKLTTKQLEQLLDYSDSPYVRCTGFLYLRYVHPPEKLWKWYEQYFLDDEVFAASSDTKRTTTMGEYVESLIMEDKYFNTVLPRLPVKVKNLYGTQLMAMDEHRRRKAKNTADIDRFVAGASVLACSKGDWLEGEIISVDLESRPAGVWVLVEDGNEELIDLGLVILLRKEKKEKKRKKDGREERPGESEGDRRRRTRSASASRERQRKQDRKASPHRRHGNTRSERGERHKRRSRSRSGCRSDSRSASSSRSRGTSPHAKTQHDLLKEFRRKEREKALATGKDYARRPTSYKSSLSSRLNNPSQSSRSHRGSSRKTDRSPSHGRSGNKQPKQGSDRDSRSAPVSSSLNEPSSTTPKEPSHEHLKKMQQLMERYSRSSAEATSDNPRTQDGELPTVMRLGGGGR